MPSIKVSTIQFSFVYASTPQQFFDHVCAPVERAAAEGAQLVALPNYTGLMLLGIGQPANGDALLLGDIARTREHRTVAAMLHAVAPTIEEFYVNLFSSVAARQRIYLAPGTMIESRGGRLYNTAYLFAPDGRIVGSQRQTHRSPREIGWGLAQGEELTVFDIGGARVGFVVGADVEYPEVSRILALQDANLLIHSAAYPLWHDEYFLLDLWREVQSNQLFGLQSCLLGNEFKGESSIYVPVEMTANRRGVLARTTRADAEEMVSATLDFDALQRVIEGYPIFSLFNFDFYTREFPGVYRETRRREESNQVEREPLFPF